MPQMNHCNVCQRGVFEFKGHNYDVKKDKCVSLCRCVECGALHIRPWDYSFDIEHPKAITGMLPSEAYMRRILR